MRDFRRLGTRSLLKLFFSLLSPFMVVGAESSSTLSADSDFRLELGGLPNIILSEIPGIHHKTSGPLVKHGGTREALFHSISMPRETHIFHSEPSISDTFNYAPSFPNNPQLGYTAAHYLRSPRNDVYFDAPGPNNPSRYNSIPPKIDHLPNLDSAQIRRPNLVFVAYIRISVPVPRFRILGPSSNF